MALRSAECTLTAAEWRQIQAAQKGKCYYCRKKTRLTQDHVIPLSKGGAHNKQNVVGACLPCNLAKGAKIVTLF